MGTPLSFDMPGTRKLAAEMSVKWQKLEKKREKEKKREQDVKRKGGLLMIQYMDITEMSKS